MVYGNARVSGDALLIVLNGIEMRVVNYFTPSLMAF